MDSAFWIKFTTISGILGLVGTALTLVGSHYLQLANKNESDSSAKEIKERVTDVGEDGINEVKQTKEIIVGRLQKQGDSIEASLHEKSQESLSMFRELNQELASATGKLKQQIGDLQNSSQETLNQITGADSYAHVNVFPVWNHNKEVDGFEWFFNITATNQGNYPIKNILLKIRERSREPYREDIVLFQGKISEMNNLSAPLAKGMITEMNNSNSVGIIQIKVPMDRRMYVFVADIEQSNRRITETTIFKKVDQGVRGHFWYRATEITDVTTKQSTYDFDPEFPPDGPDGFIDYSSGWKSDFKEISSTTEWKMEPLAKEYPQN